MKRPPAAILVLVAACVLLARAQAAERPPPFTQLLPHAELKQLSDPTILTRQAWLETEWHQFTDGTHVGSETLGVLWAWSVSPDQDWAVRLKVPANFRGGSDVRDVSGLGDIKLATGTMFRLADHWRIGGGLDLETPTGRHEVSDRFWRIQEFGAVAWDVEPWFGVSPSFEYDQSFAERSGAAPAHFLETFVPCTVTFPRRWAASVSYENKADFEDHGAVTHRAKLLVAKAFERVPLSLALSAKRTFASGDEAQVNFVATYYFR